MKDIIKYKGYTIEIMPDNDAANPRTDWDNRGTMVCWHRRHNLGDLEKRSPLSSRYYSVEYFLAEIAGIDYDSFPGGKDIKWLLEKAREKNIILPLYLYDHSGITIRTYPFNDRWDSGTVGWIYLSIEAVKNEWKWKKLTAARRKKVEDILKGEVETYDHYLAGNVYGFNIVETGESVWGYYGDCHRESGLLQEAESSVDYHIQKKTKEHISRLKEWIRNKVPLIYRKPFQLA
jgi:hypothetical protein